MSERELPEGWTLTTLGSVVTPRGKIVDPKKHSTQVFYYISLESIEKRSGNIFPIELTKGETIGSAKLAFEKGDVLYSKLRTYLQKFTIAPCAGISVTDLVPLACSEAVANNYVLYFLFSEIHLGCVQHLMSGINLPRVRMADVLSIPLPLPPLNEQRRIAAKIEVLQVRSAKAKEALEKAQSLLEQFRQSVLAAAFRGDLTARWREEHPDAEPASAFLQRIRKERRKRWEETELAKYAVKGKTSPKDWKKKYPEPVTVDTEGLPELPEGWCWASLDELGEIKGGITVNNARNKNELVEVPYLRVANVQNGYLDLREMKTIFASQQEIDSLSLQIGDVLLNEGGDRDKLGRGWVWEQQIATCIHQNHVFRMRPALRGDISIYIATYANSFGRKYFIDEGQQTTNLASISLSKMKMLPIPLPNLQELKTIVKKSITLSERMRHIGADYTETLSHLNQSILTKAFRGELVAQDPADEPASVLLERIAAEVASPVAADAKPQQVRRGRKPKPAIDPIMSFPAPGRERRLLRLMEYIIYAYPGLSTKAVEERAKLATYPTVCARLFGSHASAFRTALKASGEEWKFVKSDVVRMGRIWESLEVNYGIRISREGLCTMQDGRTPEAWPAMDTLLPLFNKAYTIFTAERHKHLDVQADLDNMGVTQKIA